MVSAVILYYFYELSLVRTFLAEDHLTIAVNDTMFFNNWYKKTSIMQTTDFMERTMPQNKVRMFTVSINYRLGKLGSVEK